MRFAATRPYPSRGRARAASGDAMRNALLACALIAALAPPAFAQSVTTYHNGLDRSGRTTVPGLTPERARGLHLETSFHATFAGRVYAQPLFWQGPGAANGMLIVATEDDTVLALDARSGATIWTRALGEPVPRDALPCGNILKLGVTGAPVIDEARAALYLAAAVMRPNGPRHEVFALSLADGAVLPGWPVDVASALGGAFQPVLQNQRGALALFGGKVFVPYSGHWGDCGAYHGFVVGVPTGQPGEASYFATRARGGGIWGQGGVSGDGTSLFAATGNTFGAAQWGDGEAVLRLGADLARPTAPKDYFAPSDWRDLDRRDLDLGGTAPIPIDAGGRRLMLAIGKDGKAYLLDRDNLGGIGGALASARVTTNVAVVSPAVWGAGDGAVVVLQGKGADCPPDRAGQGLVALKIRGGPTPSIETAWCAALVGNGSPIVTTTEGSADPLVFAVGAEGDNRLHAYRGETGEEIAAPAEAMRDLHHFQTLIATRDRIYVAADGTVYAFAF